MGKMLVTGCLSRQANPKKNRRDVMVSWLLAEALRDMGHEVEHRNPSLLETFEEFDHVFVGMAALHSLGCNRSYGVLAAILRCYPEGKVTLYIDDADMPKIMTGIRVMKNDPKKLIKPFYEYRLEYKTASKPEYHDWLMHGVNMLADYAWPKTLIPLFPWGDVNKYRSVLPNATDLQGIDLSRYVPKYINQADFPETREPVWVTEMPESNRWYQQQRPVFNVHRYGKGADKRPEDEGLARRYAEAWGVLDPGLDNGFFYSRLIYAAQARSLYVTRWQDHQALGDAYSLLADTAVGFDLKLRNEWAEAQAESLNAMTWSKAQAKDTLSSVINSKVDA